MKLKVQVLSSSPSDACSLYRGWGPMNVLHLEDRIEVVQEDGVSWKMSGRAHILFVQRPHMSTEIRAIEVAKESGLRVVIDYDDPFHLVPSYNPTWQKLKADAGYHKNVRAAIALADVVWVSTQTLKEELAKDNPNVSADKFKVIANGWDWPRWKCVERAGDARTFFWRGTNTHDKDLWEMSEQLADAILLAGATGHGVHERGSRGEGNLGYTITCMGYPFWKSVEEWVMSEIQVEVHNPVPFYKMLAMMRQTQARFGLVPLCNNKFNNCKSFNCALEMIASGMLPITAARDEFRLIPGIVCSDNYGASLSAVMDMSDADRHARWKQAVEWMRDECRLEHRNNERVESMISLI